METLFSILYFLVTNDAQYDDLIRPEMLGLDGVESSIFTNTLLMSLLSMLLLSIVFFLVLNRFFPLNQKWMWFISLFIGGLICFQISLSTIAGPTGIYSESNIGPLSEMPALGWKFIGSSVFWGMVYYYLFSIIFNRWSPFAKYTPHKGLIPG